MDLNIYVQLNFNIMFQNYRSPEDIIEEDEQRSQLTVLQRQLETTNSLCQSLLQEQQSLYQMFRAGYTTQAGKWQSVYNNF